MIKYSLEYDVSVLPIGDSRGFGTSVGTAPGSPEGVEEVAGREITLSDIFDCSMASKDCRSLLVVVDLARLC